MQVVIEVSNWKKMLDLRTGLATLGIQAVSEISVNNAKGETVDRVTIEGENAWKFFDVFTK